ncbi:hypothetical protein Taro_053298 [Colocasia esculenta]|uniref:Uncharacterized protein n=1 Tax=Colocasia esculenta TaxID=4460 RepID=A0A843XME1_COLES|nr:hypothetical protein [Colocasia esculenta]
MCLRKLNAASVPDAICKSVLKVSFRPDRAEDALSGARGDAVELLRWISSDSCFQMARAARKPREDGVRSMGVPSARRLWAFFIVFCRHKVNLPAVILKKMIASKNLQESLPYGPLLSLIFKRFSVDLSEEIPTGVKEKIGLSTLRRSHYILEDKAHNLWVKETIPQCTHVVFPDEALDLSPVPTSQQEEEAREEDRMEATVQDHQELQQVEEQQGTQQEEEQFQQQQVPVSSPGQDAPEETISQVLRDLRGKGVAQGQDDIPRSTPKVQEFEEVHHHFSLSQFETRPRS